MKHNYLDKYAHLDSFLHGLDPRTKILAFFAAIGLIVSEPKGVLFPFAFYYAVLFILIILSRIPFRHVLVRCALASPFILSAAALVPVSFILGGEAGRTAVSLPAIHLSLSIVLKAYAAVILLVLLTSTERFGRLLKGMKTLGMPGIFALMSAVVYRYIFILNDERLKTDRARQSRTPGRLKVNRFKVFGHQAAVIFLRSWERAQTVYSSMVSRGFDGRFEGFANLRFHSRDFMFLAGWFIVLSFVRIYL